MQTDADRKGSPPGPFHDATRLLREIIEISNQFELHVGRELTVNPTDLDAMENLIQYGPLSPTEIARRLGVTTAAATTIVDRLAALGHVTRTPNPADRRGILVVPTPASVEKAMGTLMPMIMGINHVMDRFDEAQQATITAYLTDVSAAYRAHIPEEPESPGAPGPVG